MNLGLTVSKASLLADPWMEEALPGFNAQLIVRLGKQAEFFIIDVGEDDLIRHIQQSPGTIMKLSSTPGKHCKPKTQTLVESHSIHGPLLKNLAIHDMGCCILAFREKIQSVGSGEAWRQEKVKQICKGCPHLLFSFLSPNSPPWLLGLLCYSQEAALQSYTRAMSTKTLGPNPVHSWPLICQALEVACWPN